MLKKILATLGFIAIVIGGSIANQFSKEIFSPSTPTPQKMEDVLIKGLTIAAEQINKRGPTMVDKDTRMDRAAVGPGSRLTYFYSLPNYSSQDMDPNWLHANVQPAVKNSVCASNEMKPSLQYGATYIYVYSGNNGTEITRFEISKSDCL